MYHVYRRSTDLWRYKEPIMMLLNVKMKLILQVKHILIILIAKD